MIHNLYTAERDYAAETVPIQTFVCINLFWMNVCRDVKIEYKILKDKVREYNKKDAQFYGNIFAKMNKVEQARTAVAKQESVPMAVDSKA